MKCKFVTPTVAAQSIFVLLGSSAEHRICNGMVLQAPTTNTGTINFGDEAVQPFTLIAGANGPVNDSNPKNVHVRGNGTDTVAIGILH